MTEHHDLVRRYPDFDSLTRGYFYPDWRLHWSTVYEVYDAAFADFGEEGRRDLRGEVEQILDAYRTDEEVLGFLDAMDVTFNPERRDEGRRHRRRPGSLPRQSRSAGPAQVTRAWHTERPPPGVRVDGGRRPRATPWSRRDQAVRNDPVAVRIEPVAVRMLAVLVPMRRNCVSTKRPSRRPRPAPV
jgi:hypothetical protein